MSGVNLGSHSESSGYPEVSIYGSKTVPVLSAMSDMI